MNANNLKLTDLKPSEAVFELASRPGKKYTLKKFSLREKLWAQKHFGGPEKINEIFAREDIGAVCEIAHHLLKDKTDFPTFESFAEAIEGAAEEVVVYRALLETIGLSQPVLQKIADNYADKEAPSPNAPSAPSSN